MIQELELRFLNCQNLTDKIKKRDELKRIRKDLMIIIFNPKTKQDAIEAKYLLKKIEVYLN